jgi:L-lactate utilization protein LutC
MTAATTFRSHLEEHGGRLHEAGSAAEARAVAGDLVAGATVARWEDPLLAAVPGRPAPASEAEVSLICADVAIAATGAIGFAHGRGRPRAVGLLPRRQVALLDRADLVGETAEALHRFYRGAARPPGNLVLVAGPSRTADIEQRHIRGMHAPRSLDVIMFGA